ncbi:hypothetical protein NP590_04985 [Methylomonas sp. SURF-2]|uniref:Nucleoside phosphorylase domain-containing protein n=1 Tax=Methylomonas subterranea TaxID=2952225 RepID=A0ABT1TDF6_9GAMM|nr:hypothetical protein [Methylomonas sp. SURF-2]MCQ8103455.1 hypothetical protein [Methylomonas sp. SURF-2]
MADSTPSVFIFCALACEAKPLIGAWKLKKLTAASHPFAIHADSSRVVVVTGIGQTAMAGAVGYTMALFAHPPLPVMLNLGIAGHHNLPLGSLVLGHKIVACESGRGFYPQFPFTISQPTRTISTQAKPNTHYSTDALFDMEASAFYEMALKFSSSELIHVVKIISDNHQSPVTAISESTVEHWISAQLAAFEEILELLLAQNPQLRPHEPELYQVMLREFHFTVSGRLKLKALLQRWRVLKGEAPPIGPSGQFRSGGEYLLWLEKQLDEAAFFL